MLPSRVVRTLSLHRSNRLLPMLLASLMLVTLLVIGVVSRSAQSGPGLPAAVGSATENPQVAREATREAPVLGVVVDSKMRVLQVEAGSAAQDVGIRPGDILVSLGGAALTDVSTGKGLIWQATRAAQTSPVALPVVLTRSGQPLTVTAQLKPPKRWRGMPTPTAVPYDEYYL